jgi:hypothetical protein
VPYIDSKAREELLRHPARKISNPGELNFMFTYLIEQYLQSNGRNYQRYNDVIGALEGAKLEMYRRSVAPYEDVKIKQNGDVEFVERIQPLKVCS